jgi:thioredoxin reductase
MHKLDVVVIGGGPAGLSAGLVLARAQRLVAIVDAGAPRNAAAEHMHGFLSQEGTSPRDLLIAGRTEVLSYGGTLIDDTVVGVEPGFQVQLATGTKLLARQILVTTGLRDEVPDIPGVRERWGRDLLHCPYCHGYEVRNQPLGVLGGTAEAIQHAMLIREWSPDVVLFSHDDSLAPTDRELLNARGVQLVEGQVARLVVNDDRLHGIELVNGTVVPRAAVFVRPRFRPNSELLTELGCAVDGHGWTIQDAFGRTSIPGVWVAGNAADPRAQVITAAGQGSATAIALNAEIVNQNVERDLATYRAALTP